MACSDKAAQPGGDMLKVAVWARVLDRWWPAAMPFPPAAPWLAGQVNRKSAERFIRTNSGELPNLPANPTDAQVGEALTALALKASVPDDIRALGATSGGCAGLKESPCDCTAAEWCVSMGLYASDAIENYDGTCQFDCFNADGTGSGTWTHQAISPNC